MSLLGIEFPCEDIPGSRPDIFGRGCKGKPYILCSGARRVAFVPSMPIDVPQVQPGLSPAQLPHDPILPTIY